MGHAQNRGLRSGKHRRPRRGGRQQQPHPRSCASKVVAAFDVNGRTPVEVRGALLTNFSFTLPQGRGALAHAAAGGNAYLLCVGAVAGSHAVHGTEMYGIVGQRSTGASEDQVVRDTFVRDAVLALASGKTDRMWESVTTVPITKGIGNTRYDPPPTPRPCPRSLRASSAHSATPTSGTYA